MSQKLDKFKGKITPNSSPKVISGVLSNLEKYLLKYEEQDAASVIKTLAKQPSTHRDKINQQKSVKQYEQRTEVLRDISKTLKKIREDMIDEQDTAYRKRPSQKSKVKKIGSKASRIAGLTKTPSKVKDLFSNILSSLLDFKSWIPMLLGGLVSMVAGIALAPFRFVGTVLKLLLKLTFKVAWKLAKFAGKAVLKLAGWLGKAALKAGKWVFSVLGKIGKSIVDFASKGLKKLGSLISDIWRSVKDKFKSKPPEKSKTKSPKDPKSPDTRKTGNKVGQKSTSNSHKIKGGFIDKAKAAVESVSKKILPALKKGGLKKVAGAVTKSLAKLATRAVPFLGWGLLAYDAYNAAKKSNSLNGFGVNLLDEVSGGLIGAALGTTDGESAGDYIEKMINGDAPMKEDSSNSNNQNSQNLSDSNNSNPQSTLDSSEMRTLERQNKELDDIMSKDLDESGASVTIVPPELERYIGTSGFSEVLRKVDRGEISIQQAISILNSQSSTTISKIENVDLSSVTSEEIKTVKNIAVAEATQNALTITKNALGTVSTSMQDLHNTVNNQMILMQPQNPNRAIKHQGNLGMGSVQG